MSVKEDDHMTQHSEQWFNEVSALSFDQIVDRAVSRAPDTAFIYEVDGRHLTYREAADGIGAWAAHLHSLGVRSGQHVLTMLPMNADAVLIWAALNRLGAVDVPINTGYRGEMLRYVIKDADAQCFLVDSRYRKQLDGVPGHERPNLVLVDRVVPPPVDRPGCRESLLESSDPGGSTVSCMIYTSGTTGSSKGVLVTMQQMYAMSRAIRPPSSLQAGERCYVCLPFFHVLARSLVQMTAGVVGTLVLRERFSFENYWDEINRYECRLAAAIGATPVELMKRATEAPESNSLRSVAMGPVLPNVDHFCERFEVEVYSWYGSTESGIPLKTENVNQSGEAVGKPVPGYECRVVDDSDFEAPRGQVGELVIRTTVPYGITSGYWNKPEETVEAFRNLWFHTGDTFKVDDDGWFHFVDRLKDSIRRKGENISSVEVERDINAHPDVLESAVVPVRDEHGEEEVKAVVVLCPGRSLTEIELLKFVAPRMPHFMVPRYIELVDSLPKTVTAKVRKVDLRADGVTNGTWDRQLGGVRLRDLVCATPAAERDNSK